MIDTSNGGTLEGTIAALGIAIGMAGPDTKIIPGHGEISTREDVMEFRAMILVVAERVKQLGADGRTCEEVAAADPTAEFNEQWGDPTRFLTAVYQQLSEGS